MRPPKIPVLVYCRDAERAKRVAFVLRVAKFLADDVSTLDEVVRSAVLVNYRCILVLGADEKPCTEVLKRARDLKMRLVVETMFQVPRGRSVGTYVDDQIAAIKEATKVRRGPKGKVE